MLSFVEGVEHFLTNLTQRVGELAAFLEGVGEQGLNDHK
jgi:hypothetical protein